MIRLLLFLIVVAAAALALGWIADRPGEVAIVWLNYRVETSVMVLASAVLALMASAILAWTFTRGLIRAPRRISSFMSERRLQRSRQAIARGLVAVGAGDLKLARRLAHDAQRRAPDDPLTLLLAAQTAQLSNDPAGAEQTFRAMLDNEETKLLGLHGLYIEASRSGDVQAAQAFAEEATRVAPGLAWAGQAALEFRGRGGDWAGALAALERNMRHGLLNRADYRRQRAVLLTARAAALEDTDRDAARHSVLEAFKLAPDLVPTAALAGRLLADAGETRRAARLLETAWRKSSHPEIADAYAHLRSGDSARERLSRIQSLVRQSGEHSEGMLALARAALDAREFAIARTALAPLLAAPTRRVALLMAELEEREHGDIGRAREWMARAIRAGGDPAWSADGIVSESWLPASPVTGRLDAFEWKIPPAQLAAKGPVIEAAEPPVLALDGDDVRGASVVVSDAAPGSERTAADDDKTRTVAPATSAAKPNNPAAAASPRAATPRRFAVRPIPQVIPLVNAPDDPGPPDPPRPRRRLGFLWRR